MLPQTISWNLTRLCNLSCGHCYLDAGTRAGGRSDELDTGSCLGIIDQIHALSPDTLIIMTGGEPLLRPDIHELCRHAAQKGLWVVLGTNGTALTTNRVSRLKQDGVRGVGISIDSLDPAVHDSFRGLEGAWEKAAAGITAAVTGGLDTVIQVSVFDWNMTEIADLAAWARERGARAVNYYFLVCTGRGQGQTGLAAETTEEVLGRLYELQRQYRGEMLVNAKCAPQHQRVVYQADPASPHLHTFQGGCPAATHYCRIDPRGEVTPCPYLPESGGNLAADSLASIWEESPLFEALRQRDRLSGRCGRCEYRPLCSGCRARALAAHGDMMGEDPACAYRPPPGGRAPVVLPEESAYQPQTPRSGAVEWDQDALAALQRIPPMVRTMVRKRMESHAVKEGRPRITRQMMIEAREKRAPLLR